MDSSLCQGPVLSALLGRDGPEVGDLRVEEEEPPDPQLQGQGPFLFQGLPVVEEDEVGAGLPAHVGEVPGAEVGGEKDRRLQPPPQLAELLLGDGVPHPPGGGEEEVLPGPAQAEHQPAGAVLGDDLLQPPAKGAAGDGRGEVEAGPMGEDGNRLHKDHRAN